MAYFALYSSMALEVMLQCTTLVTLTRMLATSQLSPRKLTPL
jgi:hypothetical protein